MKKTWPRAQRLLTAMLLAAAGIFFGAPARAQAVDEARQAGRAAQSLPAADEDYFHGMDGGVPLTSDEVKGRDMWLVWTGGNDRLWDRLTGLTFGSFDLLKITVVPSRPQIQPRQPVDLSGSRQRAVLRQAHRPRPEALTGCGSTGATRTARPTRLTTRRNIPASRWARAARTSRPAPITATPTGIVGLRLFPNPAFDETAAKRWDPQTLLQ